MTLPGHVCAGTKVDKVVAGGPDSRPKVMLTDGTTLQPAKGVVVAVEGPEARRILGDALQVEPMCVDLCGCM